MGEQETDNVYIAGPSSQVQGTGALHIHDVGGSLVSQQQLYDVSEIEKGKEINKGIGQLRYTLFNEELELDRYDSASRLQI